MRLFCSCLLSLSLFACDSDSTGKNDTAEPDDTDIPVDDTGSEDDTGDEPDTGDEEPDTGDEEPVDTDGDGYADADDNCPDVANADQMDQDGDADTAGGDACDTCTDTDDDGFGAGDLDAETCPADTCEGEDDAVDIDGDAIPDACDDIIASVLAAVPDGGPKTSILERSPTEPSRIYGMSTSGTMYQTDDHGESWGILDLPDEWDGGFPYSLAVSPLDANVLIMGAYGGQIYRSEDAGVSWIAAEMPEDWIVDDEAPWHTAPSQIVWSLADPSVVYVRLYQAGLVSTDGGLTYSHMGSLEMEAPDETRSLGDMVTDAVDSQQVWMVSRNDVPFAGIVHESTDGGMSWTHHTAPDGECMSAAVDPNASGTIWCSKAAVYRSVDGGAEWEEMSELPVASYPDTLVLDPSDSSRMYMGMRSQGPAVSVDGGVTWTMMDDPVIEATAARTYTMSIDPTGSGEILFGGSFGHQRSSDNGESFVVANEGLGGLAYVGQVEVSPFDENIVLIQGTRSLFWSDDAGTSWTETADIPQCSNWLSSQLTADPHHEGQWYYACGSNGLYVSTNDGRSFTHVSNPEEFVSGGPDAASVYVHPTVPDRLYVLGGGTPSLVRSDDGGETWAATSLDISWATSFSIHPEMPSIMYVGGSRGTVWWSNDGGESWTAAEMLRPDGEGAHARQVLPDSLDSSHAWAHDASRLYKTENGGVTWDLVFDPEESGIGFYSPVVRLDDNSLVITNESVGLYRSTDEAETWTSIDVAPAGTDLVETSDGLLMSTEESGVWRIHL